MGALVGLGVGVGLVLCWSAFALPRPERAPRTGPGLLRALLMRAGWGHVSAASFVSVCCAAALIVGLVVQVIAAAPPVAVAFAVMAGYGPVALVRSRGRRRQAEMAQVWPEAVDNLASAVRAGLSLPEALGSLAERGPEVLRPAFVTFALDYQVSGRFAAALDRLKDHLADPVGDRVIEGLRIAREVGGSELGPILRNLSGFLREEARTRSELEARQAWTVNGARLAVAAPWLVLLLMSFQPEVIARYATPTGALVLAVGGGLCAAAYRAMMRIGQLPVEQRVLS